MLIYQSVPGKESLIKQLSKRILERALEAKMQGHLGMNAIRDLI